MFDEVHLRELYKVSNNLTRENVGDSMVHAVAFRSLIVDPRNKDIADRMMNVIRAFARDADIVTRMKQVERGGWYPVKQYDASPGMPSGAGASG
jgi:hypothetical protein